MELNSLPRGGASAPFPLSKSFDKIQSVLADGPLVEIKRLEKICDVWKLDLKDIDDKAIKDLAANFEIKLYNLAGESLKHDSNHLKKLSDQEKNNVCFELSKYLCGKDALLFVIK